MLLFAFISMYSTQHKHRMLALLGSQLTTIREGSRGRIVRTSALCVQTSSREPLLTQFTSLQFPSVRSSVDIWCSNEPLIPHVTPLHHVYGRSRNRGGLKNQNYIRDIYLNHERGLLRVLVENI